MHIEFLLIHKNNIINKEKSFIAYINDGIYYIIIIVDKNYPDYSF